MTPDGWFEPVLEWYTPPSDFSRGTYFGLARTGDAGGRCGYLATQDFHGEFRECEFPLKELEALEKTLKAISISLGSSVGALHGGSGLIRIYHGREGWIDFFYRNIEQPQWDPLLAFIHETTERFRRPRSLRCRETSSMLLRPRNSSREPMEEKRPLRRQPDDHHLWSLIMLAVTAGGFLLVTWIATKALLFFIQEAPIP